MTGWLYVVLCVIGPAIWGVLMYFLFNLLDARRSTSERPPRPPVDYSI